MRTRRFNILLVALFAMMLSISSLASAQAASPVAAAAGEKSPERKITEGVPLVFWNRPITIFRSYNEEVSPAERVAGAVARLGSIPESASGWNIQAADATNGQRSGMIVMVNGKVAFGILTEDLDRESGETLKSATDDAIAQLRAALEARFQQRQLPALLRAIGLTLAVTILLIIGLWLDVGVGRRVLARIDRTAPAARSFPGLGGFNVRPLIYSINQILAKLTVRVAALAMIYLWLTFVLLRFPYSQPWGEQLGTFLLNLFGMLGTGLLRSLPGIFTVLVVFLLTRILTRIVGGLFDEVEKGDIQLSWLHPDTARATRQLVIVLIWIFAVTVAYPFIPGSDTEAFKGVSVFVGLMVSLGSAGLINQMMSGLVAIYSRALRPGDFVRVGDDTGVVTDVGMLSTKLLTRKREEITIPNAVLVSTKIVNYSRHAAGLGGVVGTTVTIGYNAPWRQVHAILLQAAAQTEGVRKDPAPQVWQKALSDFYVEYELVFNMDDPSMRVPVLSQLHQHIQDAFNEQGVQIMTPHFEGQPDEKVLVPKSRWFSKPTDPPPSA